MHGAVMPDETTTEFDGDAPDRSEASPIPSTDASSASGKAAADEVADSLADALVTRASLLSRLGRLDEDGWVDFERLYAGLIRSVARAAGVPATAVDDVVQEVRVALVRTMPDFEYDPARGRFRGYLRTATRRAAWQHYRREGTARAHASAAARERAASADAGFDDAFDAAFDRAWRLRHLAEALRAIEPDLRPRDRAVFAAVAVHGRRPADVAAEYELTVDHVYAIRSRTLGRLRAVVAAQVRSEADGPHRETAP